MLKKNPALETSLPDGPESTVPSPPRKWLVFSLVAAGVFMSTLDSSIVNIALPVIMADFQVPLTVIEWVPMIYLLTVSSLLLTCGRLSDIRGRRLVYCGGFIVFSAGSLLCAVATDAPWLIVSRAVQGVGAAMLTIALLLFSRLSANATALDMAWRLALAGIGIAVFISPNSAAAMGAVPPRHRGIAAGSVATARNLGMVMGVAMAGLIFNSTFRHLNNGQDLTVYAPAMEPAFVAAFRRAMLAGAAVVGLGIVVAWLRGPDSGRNGSGESAAGPQEPPNSLNAN